MTSINAYREQAVWGSMADMYRRLDSMIVGRRVDVRLYSKHETQSATGDPSVPAWSNGTDVFLNVGALNAPTSSDAIIALTGVNYHEVCHLKFTPRVKNDKDLAGPYLGESLHPYFNILEDQKIESWFTDMYPIAGDYFRAMFTDYLLSNEQGWDTLFPLAHGRLYVDQEIRDQLEARYKGNNKENIKAVIDYYKTLVYPGNKGEMLWSWREFKRLLTQDLGGSAGQQDPCPHGKASAGSTMVAGDLNKKDQEKAADKSEEENGHGESYDSDYDDIQEEGTRGKGKGKAEEDGDDASDGSESGGGSGEGDEPAESDDGSGDGTGTGGDAGDADSTDQGNGAGAPGTNNKPITDSAFRSLIAESHDNTVAGEAITNDVIEKRKAIISGVKPLKPDASRRARQGRPVPPEYKSLAKRVEKEFLLASVKHDPGWEIEKPHGSLNIQEAMRERPNPKTMFREWYEGNDDATNFEVAILIDVSSSMAGTKMYEVSLGLWCLRKSLQVINANVTAWSFANGANLLNVPTDKVSSDTYDNYMAQGGTSPAEALTQAAQLLATSKRKQKLLIVLTDGDWWNPATPEQIIRDINSWGVTTSLYFYETYKVQSVNAHECRTGHQIMSGADLVQGVKGTIKSMMKAAR